MHSNREESSSWTLFDAIYQRRAVKHYDPEHRFSEAEIEKLMEAAIQTPTSFNHSKLAIRSGSRQGIATTDPSRRE